MFKIYNASAGSGKTYTLVKDYLSVVLNADAYLPHRQVLAMTFTNKAVDEMKQRIVSALIRFSKPEILTTPDDLFIDLVSTLNITPQDLHLKSRELIHKILHNYGGFEVSTIDKFNQKLIRTFAHDLKLPINFDVELDTNFLLRQAVDNLITRIGQNNELTSVLIDYAIMKSDDDKSWDIALDLYKSAKLLTDETSIPVLKAISNNDLKSFQQFKRQIDSTYNKLKLQIEQISNDILEKIERKGLEHSDFSRSSVPKYFLALAASKFNVDLDTAWQKTIEDKPLYPQKTNDTKKDKIDALHTIIIEAVKATKSGIYNLRYLANIRKNIIPIAVLTLIKNELDLIKKEQSVLLISEFNALIANEIRDQPTPFIYERIGEKFKHYFIDEFQDTSVLQWQNLTPLLINALSSGGDVLLVGDAKQSIYRWRGGDPEQFIDLINNTSSFPIKAKLDNLPKNYRSCEQIVAFNNDLFKYISLNFFSQKRHQELYQSAYQKTHSKKQGYVQLSFLDLKSEDDKAEHYAKSVYNTIQSIKASDPDMSYSDICVLVRKKAEGISIANYLIANEMKVISNETLLVSKSPEVQFIIHVLTYLQNPSDHISKLSILNYLIQKHDITSPHQFRLSQLPLKRMAFFASLQTLGIDFNSQKYLRQSIYDCVEGIIRSFGLVQTSDAYIHFFLDFVFEFSQKEDSSLIKFLEHYEQQKDSLSIRSPKQTDAIQITTIHKSKGLEFPIVILPFADLNIYKEIDPKEWMPTSHLEPNIPFVLLNYNKDFKHFGTEAKARYHTHQSKLELDNINLFYVALTRAVEQLYIIGDSSGGIKPLEDLKTFSDLLIRFLDHEKKWDANVSTYHFGKQDCLNAKDQPIFPTIIQKTFVSSTSAQSKIGLVVQADQFWSDQQKEAVERGNLLHLLLSHIYTKQNIKTTIDQFISSGHIEFSQAEAFQRTLASIVEHPELKLYFSPNLEIFNEKEIITESGQIMIPDRLIIKPNNKAVIIDYKTGEHYDRYHQQLESYANTVKQMGYQVEKKILVYIYPKLEIKAYN